VKPLDPIPVSRVDAPRARRSTWPGTVAIALLALGGINWVLIGLAGVDALAWLFGVNAPVTRAVHLLLGALAVYCLVRLPRWSRAS
jgi:uncharacterized membrane protein YuzA (DUF378 family)